MIATGTGVAPFMGIILEKMRLGEASRFQELGLIFGCREENCDYICKQKLNEAVEKNALNYLLTGFSQGSVG